MLGLLFATTTRTSGTVRLSRTSQLAVADPRADDAGQLTHDLGEELLAVAVVGDGVDREVQAAERRQEDRHPSQLLAHQGSPRVGRMALAEPAGDDGVLDREDPEEHEEAEDGEREQQYLHG